MTVESCPPGREPGPYDDDESTVEWGFMVPGFSGEDPLYVPCHSERDARAMVARNSYRKLVRRNVGPWREVADR